MRIAYILNYSIAKTDGVTRKIATQSGEWRKMGHSVELFSLFSDERDPALPALQFPCKGVLRRKIRLIGEALEELAKFGPDIVYLRYTYWNRTLGRIQAAYRNIVEINSDDVKEFEMKQRENPSFVNAVKKLLNSLLRVPVLKMADAFAAVTYELASSPSFTKFGKRAEVFPNGCHVCLDARKGEIAVPNEKIGFFFIGSPGLDCHGLDFIVCLSEQLPEFNFHVVGIEGENTGNLFFHGFMQEEEYAGILGKCNVCIGSLATYRKGLAEACPLKVREYIAKGFPIMIGYDDTAFKASGDLPEWILRIDTRERLDVEKIREFAHIMKNYVVSREDAEKYVGAAGIEKRRVEFLESVSKGARRHA